MKWRHPLFFFLILCMLGVSPSAGADISRWPSLYEKGSYQTRVAKTNQLLWEVQWESLVTQHEKKRQVEINEKGDGKPWGYSEPIHWEKKMEFDVAPSFMFRSVTGERTNTAGKKLSHLTIRADSEKSVLFYEDQESPDKPASRTKKSWNPKTIPDEILFQWVRSLNITQSPAGECELVTSPTRRL